MVAALSPLKGWTSNQRLATQALQLWLSRGSLEELPVPKSRRAAATNAFRGDVITGPKVTAFAEALALDHHAAVIDRHMFDLAEVKHTTTNHRACVIALHEVANAAHDWPANVQAGLWGWHRAQKGYRTYA